MHGADCSALQLERITIARGSKFENDRRELETRCLARTRTEIVLDSGPGRIKHGAQSPNGARIINPSWGEGRRGEHDKPRLWQAPGYSQISPA
jgi:hypothetical protein